MFLSIFYVYFAVVSFFFQYFLYLVLGGHKMDHRMAVHLLTSIYDLGPDRTELPLIFSYICSYIVENHKQYINYVLRNVESLKL